MRGGTMSIVYDRPPTEEDAIHLENGGTDKLVYRREFYVDGTSYWQLHYVRTVAHFWTPQTIWTNNKKDVYP